MTQDHDDLDYDAWVAPPAPDVTDAVIAKARVTMATATETVDAKRSTRTMLLAGGAIALSIAAIVIAVMVDRSKQPPPAPSIADLRVEELEKKVDELEAAIGKLNAIGTEPTPTPDPQPAMMPPACDVAALSKEGKDYYSKSQWGAALATFEKAFDCKQTKESALYASLAACKSGRATEAKRYYEHVDEQKRPHIQQTCLQHGIELGIESEKPTASDSPPTTCDADALFEQGKGFYAKGQWSAALQKLAQAYDCKADDSTALFAAMSACKAGKAADAKRWYKKSPEEKGPNILQTCLAKGIDLQ